MIHKYLMKRENLMCTFILIDSRLKPQKNDLEFIEWFGVNQLPFVLVYTKSDKINKKTLVNNLDVYKATLKEKWSELPQIIVSSSKSGLGKEAVLELVKNTNPLFQLEQ
jgi:GTP-binding protein